MENTGYKQEYKGFGWSDKPPSLSAVTLTVFKFTCIVCLLLKLVMYRLWIPMTESAFGVAVPCYLFNGLFEGF
jgi:hypothetical protein